MEPEQLKADYEEELLNHEDVTSVGIGLDDDGNKVLKVGVKHGRKDALVLPEGLSTEDVEVEEVGEFVPEVVGKTKPQADRTSRFRPVVGGVSVGHKDITAGTASYLLTDGTTVFTASNNHVYANINSGQPGDPIYQPGPHDGGTSDDQSATLEDYVPVEDGTTVDLAWATQEVEHTKELLEVGVPEGEPVQPEVGDTIIKSGRTTGVTEGQVQQGHASVKVNFGDAGTIVMEDQFITGDMSDGGDSGSAGLRKSDMAPAGLLFAGSDSATVFNYATNVEAESGLSIVTKESNQLPTAEVSVALEEQTPDTGNVIVRVSDTGGSSLGNATVSVSGPVNETGATDSSGVAEFTEVPIGDYTISVEKSGYKSASATVTSGDFE